MIKVYQTKFGKEGNCFPACLASILEVDINSVPDFRDEEKWFYNYKRWLSDYGLDLLIIRNWKHDFARFVPKVYAVVSGKSPRGLQHSTVYYGDELIHDPHPEGGGVKDITDWIYIIPVLPTITSHFNKTRLSVGEIEKAIVVFFTPVLPLPFSIQDLAHALFTAQELKDK